MDKKRSRIRRSKKTRGKILELKANRLCVNRSSQHIYAQIISSCGSKTLAQASTLDKEIAGDLKHGGNKAAAEKVGALIAKRAKEAGIDKVAFDRSGFKYHGRIKALADAARAGGMNF